jgi:GNAT superfamily N-acetyltransferase
MGFAALQSQRVGLREHNGVEDAATIEPWLAEAVAAAAFPDPVLNPGTVKRGWLPREIKSGMLVIEQVRERAPIGFLEYEVAGGWLTFAFIGLAKPYRGWGYGSEAVRLVEEWATREGIAEWFRAEVPLGNGLGLYFWLRLGYRPGDSAEVGRDVMTMVREIESGEG